MKPMTSGSTRIVRGRVCALTLVAGVSIVSPGAAQIPAAQAPAAAPSAEAAQRLPGEPPRPAPAPGAGAAAQSPAHGEAAPAAATQGGDMPAQESGDATLSSTPGSKALGISILGNQEAPTSLVIVPWKSSELGSALGNAPMLDDSRQPVDKDVFMRALRYYEIRSEPAGHGGMTTGGRENAAATGSATQPAAARRR
jgi:hypothetical protein